MRKTLILTILVLVAASCSVFRKYERPKDISADGVYGVGVETADSTTVADIPWSAFFRDAKLRALITEALESNSDVLIAEQRIAASYQGLRTARLAYVPSVSFDPQIGTATSKKYDPTQFTYDIPLDVTWDIDINGKMLGKKRRAKASYESAIIHQRVVRSRVIAAVANAYYTLLMLDAQMEISRQTSESWKMNVRTMKAMKSAGMTNEASISRSEASAYAIDASLVDLEYDIREVQNSLSLILGCAPCDFERGRIDEQEFDEHISIGVPALLLSRRPDVMYAEKALEQAFYNTSVARADLYPSLRLTGSGGWENTLSNPSTWFFSFAAQLVAPIFNGGQRRAAVKVAEAQQKETAIAFRQTLLKAGSEVNDALAKCKASRGKADLRQKQIDALASAVNSTQQLMRHSQSTYLEVITAQQALLAAQLLQASDKLQALQGVVNLYTALGGGGEKVEVEKKKEEGEAKRK